MNITYREGKSFQAQELKDLFLSVQWASGQYPEKLVVAMAHSDTVFSAWDGDTLIGLINVLDDSVMNAYVHYLLVRPEYQGHGVGKKLLQMVKEAYQDYLKILLVSYADGVEFYRRCGFCDQGNTVPMYLTSLSD
ncbi:MAG: GNAT family N-acetyltransferase [Clostridiales bacterium]|jgi:ribosomal protein S18 acetylase RimI-like enzyme|nr:GNAT family N-acetyltransferase [Clostridiales bacterium]